MGEMWRGRGGNINLVSFGRMKVLYISDGWICTCTCTSRHVNYKQYRYMYRCTPQHIILPFSLPPSLPPLSSVAPSCLSITPSLLYFYLSFISLTVSLTLPLPLSLPPSLSPPSFSPSLSSSLLPSLHPSLPPSLFLQRASIRLSRKFLEGKLSMTIMHAHAFCSYTLYVHVLLYCICNTCT